jgi:diguanylate cyclase (GGDEF)-like protein
MWRFTLELGALALAAGLIIGLMKVCAARRHALGKLEKSIAELRQARELERKRAEVLEMIGNGASLGAVLSSFANLLAAAISRAGCAVWALEGSALRYQAAAGLPHEFCRILSGIERLPGDENTGGLSRLELQLSGANLACEYHLTWLTGLRLADPDGSTIGFVEVFGPEGTEIPRGVLPELARMATLAIENRRLYDKLAYQAQSDTLTGLPNRLLFQDRLHQAIRAARRYGRKTAVIWIDLDRYKQVNDSLGHAAGDDLLRQIAQRLLAAVRDSDTVSRVGGDEFTVLLADIGSEEDAQVVVAKIMSSISAPILAGDSSLTITASCGVSLFPEHGGDPVKLIRAADVAMYAAKRAGRNGHCMYRPQLDVAMRRRRDLERNLERAMERQELYLEYQPLIDAACRTAGVEALLRWKNPVLGSVSPGEFIPVAEEMGVIVEIGEWVLRQACADGAAWLQAGCELPRISVNVSPVQLARADFVERVESVLAASGFPSSLLEMEVTETALMRDLDGVIGRIERLRNLGIRFAIDDFGTGYSSLSQLHQLPVDSVKIDRSFVKDIGDSANISGTVIQGIIGLAHNLRLRVVAEGVETEQQLSLLKSFGCGCNQGFYLHRPMSAEAVRRLLPSPEYRG